jgi:sugar/nucleoside kinase (ribokinase family)
MHEVLCAGLIVADHVSAPIPKFPAAGSLVKTDRLEVTIGGCGANTAVDLAKLGVDVGLAGMVGDDVLGRYCLEFLRERNVGCELVTVSKTTQTSATLIVNVKGEDRRFIHAVGANADFTGTEIPQSAIDKAKVVAVGGFGLNPALSGPSVASLFRKARPSGATTLLDVVIGDPAPVGAMLAEALPETDVFLPNHDEAKLLTGLDDPWKQAEQFRRLGAETVVITAGREGAFAVSPQERVHLPSFEIEQVDGTGSGDAFVAGFIFGLLQKAELKQCLGYGAAMGASCVRAVGATTGVFNREELTGFLSRMSLISNDKPPI